MRRAFALLLAAALAAAAPAGALPPFKYLAFGDSITFGTFDTNEVGYPKKLENRLDNAGRPSTVVKRGVPGETTAGGLTRLDSVLAEGGQVLLLMEGTNDVLKNNISVETAHANLAAMADKATLAGVDTVHMTIIPMKKQGANEPHPKNGQAAQLTDMVAQTAQENDHWLVDLFDTWSGINNLYQDYYYQGAEDPVGHPRRSGYQLMSLHIANVLLAPLPGAAAPTAPGGDITDPQPTYEWEAASGATWYELWIKDGGGGTVYRQWHKASEHCASPCAVTPPAPLPGGGGYSWTVQPRNPGGLGPASAQQAFALVPPAPATPLSPAGPIFATDPTFVWTEVEGATDYRLEVEDDLGPLHDAWYDAGMICGGGGSCSTTPALALAPGDHRWRITSSGAGGDAPASADLEFEVRSCPAGDLTVGPGSQSSDSELYEACGKITVTGFTVGAGLQATFLAGGEVQLDNGTVFAGGSSIAIING